MERVTIDIDAKLNGMDEAEAKITALLCKLEEARTLMKELTSMLENSEISILLGKDKKS